MRILTKGQIVKLNRTTITENGGQFIPSSNFLHGATLDFVVEMVD